MLTKRNVILLVLSSIILMLAVYYVTPNEKAVSKELDTKKDAKVTIKESDEITALKVNRDNATAKEIDKVKSVLNDESKKSEEKNDAYEALKRLTTNKGKEASLEKAIKKNFNYDAFINIDNNKVKVVIDSNKHSYDLATKIITFVEKEFDENVYTTVEFNK